MMSREPNQIASGDQREADAQDRLRRCPYPILRRVHCNIHEDVLVLTGVVPTFYAKQIAQEVMRGIERITRIDNQLVVTT